MTVQPMVSGIIPEKNHFSLFGLPVRFALDLAALERAWKVVQGAVHPDRYVSAPESQRLMALQRATQVNDAHDTLKDPIRRASYLCGLYGVAVDPERNTTMPSDFLVQQMEWRESLEDAAAARDLEALSQLDQEVAAAITESELLIEHLLDQSPADPVRAADEIRRLMFLSKFSGQLRDEQRRLTDGTASDI